MFKHEENANQIKKMKENLRLFREEKNWSIEELSRISEIKEKELRGIENEADFEVEYLFMLCYIYGVKVHEIFLPIDKQKK